MEQSRTAKHNHQCQIKAGKRAIKTRRNVAKIICLEDARGACERAAHHQRADLMEGGIDSHRTRERVVLADCTEGPAVGRVDHQIGGQETYQEHYDNKVIRGAELIEVEAENRIDGSDVQARRGARKRAAIGEG